MNSEITRWVVLGILNIPLYLGLGRLIFDDWAGFFRCVGFWFTPDFWSMISGELFDDWWGTTKLFVFFALCTGAVYAEYQFFFGSSKKNPEITQLRPNPSFKRTRLRLAA